MKKVMLLASEDLCGVLQCALKKKYSVFPCSDPAAGEAILPFKPDALILDLFLPGADGLTFLKNNALCLPPVVIALTAFVSDDLLRKLSDLGVAAVIRIPCNLPYLEQQLTKLLAKKCPSR